MYKKILVLVLLMTLIAPDFTHAATPAEVLHSLRLQLQSLSQLLGSRPQVAQVSGSLPTWVPAPGEVALLTQSNGKITNQFESQAAPYYDAFHYVKTVNDYSGAFKNPYWGQWGATVFWGGGHAGTNDNTVTVAEYGTNAITFKRVSDPTPWTGSTGSDANNKGSNSTGDFNGTTLNLTYMEGADGQPGSPHSYGSGDIVGPEHGGATNGTLVQIAASAVNYRNDAGAVAAHKIDFDTTSLQKTNGQNRKWTRITNNMGGGGFMGASPHYTAFVPSQNRIYYAASSGDRTRWFDRNSNTYVIGSGTGFDFGPSDGYDSGIMFHVPTRNLLVAMYPQGNQLKVQWMDVSVNQPSVGGTATLSQNLSISDPWSAATWVGGDTNRIVLIGVSGDNNAAYEIEIPSTLSSAWTVTRAPFGSGQTMTPGDPGQGIGLTYKKFGYDEKVDSIVYMPRAERDGADEKIWVYRPRTTTGGTTPPPTPTAPVVSLTASPSTISSGQSSTLTWSSTNSTSCTASNGWSGAKGTSGTESVSPTTNATYALSCTGAGGTGNQSVTVSVSTTPTPVNGSCGTSNGGTFSSAPTTNLCTAGTPGSVTTNTNTYTWNCGGQNGGTTAQCTATRTTTPPPSGSVLQSGVPVTNISGASKESKYFTITVPAGTPTLTVTTSGGTGDADLYVRQGTQPTVSSYDQMSDKLANSETITVQNPQAGTYHILVYGYGNFSGVTLEAVLGASAPTTPVNGSCGTSNGGTFSSAPNTNLCTAGTPGSVTTNTNTYTWNCGGQNGGTTAQCTATRTTTPQVPTVSLSASPTTLNAGDATTLTWSSQNSTSCTASNGWTGAKAVSGTQSVSPTTNTTYSLICAGSGGTSTAQSVSITVNPVIVPNPTPSGSGIVQFITHDGDMLGDIDNSSAPSRDFWNNVLKFRWKRGGWGDWMDATQKQYGESTSGAVPYASFAVPQPGTYTANVTTLVSRWMTTGNNRGFYLRMKNNAWPVRFAGRTDATASRRPTLTVVTSTGTYSITARANATWNMSTYSILSRSDQFELSGQQPAILHFSLDGVTGTVQSATLKVTDIAHDGGGSGAGGTVEVYEADPPQFTVPNQVTNPTLGYAYNLNNFQAIASQPATIFSDDFATPGPLDTGWSNTPQRVVNPNTNTTYARGSLLKGDNESLSNKRLAMKGAGGEGGQGMDVQRDELYSQYHLYLENDYGSNTDGIKIPAMGGQFGYWRTYNGGYWQMTTGNGGYPGTGLKVNNGGRWDYEGHSVRIVTNLRAADNSAYADLYSVNLYPYNLDQNGPFPDMEQFPYVALQKGNWYAIDLYMKQNTMSGARDANGNYATANADGVYKVWINGHPAFSKTNFRWRKHPEIGVEGLWLDVYHGGVQPAPYDMHYRLDRVTVATSYVGPQKTELPGGITPPPQNQPTVSVSASPTNITSGGATSLTWASTNSTSCTASGGWTGTKATSGTQSVSPTTNTTYTLTCTGAGGSAVQSVTVTVSAVPTTPPTLTLTAFPTSVTQGAGTVLNWSTTDSTSCTASGGWSGTKAVTGSQSVTPSANTTYTLACTGAGGTVTQSATVTVIPTPTVSLSASPSSITTGQSSTLSWSSGNSTSCTASGGWSGAKSTSGTQSVTPSANTTYTLACTGAGGTATQNTTVTVSALPSPNVTISASPSSIAYGGTSVITWSSSNSTSCTVSNGGSGTSGSFVSPSLTANTTYTATCTGSGGSASQSVTVSVAPQPQDTTAPTASLTAPANGGTVSGSSVTVSANATDNVGVTGVQFTLDGQNLGGEDTAQPYAMTWDTTLLPDGTYTLGAKAKDAKGNTGNATTRTITVKNTVAVDTTAPTVTITEPGSGTTIGGSAVALSANATDNVGVVSVQFTVDGQSYGSPDTTFPYGVLFDTTKVANGSHTIGATAKDAKGNVGTAQAVTVTVNNVSTPVDVTAPSIPQGLTVVTRGSDALSLTWDLSADDVGVTGYHVERCEGSTCTNWKEIGISTGNAYKDGGLSSATTYRYRVRATDAKKNLSGYSEIKAGTTEKKASSGGGGGGGGSKKKKDAETIRKSGLITPDSRTNLLLSANAITQILQSGGGTSGGVKRVFTQSLYVGLTSPEVRMLQEFLKEKGLLGSDGVTGFYGNMTMAAVKQYQCQKGIACSGTPDSNGYGLVGARTRATLNAEGGTTSVVPTVPPVLPQGTVPTVTTGGAVTTWLFKGMNHPQVASLQSFLMKGGYLPQDTPTTFFGTLTESALKRFQCEKLSVCSGTPDTTGYGATGPRTRALLY